MRARFFFLSYYYLQQWNMVQFDYTPFWDWELREKQCTFFDFVHQSAGKYNESTLSYDMVIHATEINWHLTEDSLSILFLHSLEGANNNHPNHFKIQFSSQKKKEDQLTPKLIMFTFSSITYYSRFHKAWRSVVVRNFIIWANLELRNFNVPSVSPVRVCPLCLIVLRQREKSVQV